MSAQPTPALVLRSLLVSVMAGALMSALVAVVQLVLPDWQATALIIWCALAVGGAQWTHWLLWHRLPLSIDRHWFRAAELACWLVTFAFADLLARGLPLVRIVQPDATFFVGATLLTLSWFSGTITASDFARLGETPDEDQNYVVPLETLTARFLGGGALQLLALGLTTIELNRAFSATRPSISGLFLNATLYFLCGMALLALAQHALMERAWRESGVRVAPGMAGRWTWYSLAFLMLTALLAVMLPTAYGGGLLDLLALILTAIIALLSLLGIGLTAPFIWLLSLLTGSSSPAAEPVSPPAIPSPPPVPPGGEPPPFLDLLRWIALGLLVAAFVVWLLRGWLANRSALVGSLGRVRPLWLIRAFLAALFRRLRGYTTALMALAPRRRPVPTRDVRAGGGWRLRGARTPREQVIRYYASLVRRATAAGVPRRLAQTPDEYAATLQPRVTEAAGDLARLTAAFVEARYSDHAIAPAQSGAARGHWERLRAALRRGGEPSPPA